MDNRYKTHFTDVKMPEVIEYLSEQTGKTQQLKILKLLDSGGTGSVYYAADNHQEYAIKIGIISEDEKEVLKSIDEYYGEGEIEGHRFYVMKFKGLFNINQFIRSLNERGERLSEDQAFKIIEGCINAIQVLHARNMAHNDIQCKNICLDDNLNASLVDYSVTGGYWEDNMDFKYLRDGVVPFIVIATNIENRKNLQQVLDNMIDSRGLKLSKNQVEEILTNYQLYKRDLIGPAKHIIDTRRLFTSSESEMVIDKLNNASDDYLRYLIAVKFIQSHPEKAFANTIKAYINDSEFKGDITLPGARSKS